MSATEPNNGPAIEPEGDWFNLYKGSTSRDDHLFTAESVRHPAKMSLALTNKILDTMQEWGWIEAGSLVVDPFGGRGTTALCWLARNAANRALTVELEPHFVEMQNRNKEHAERRLHRELAWVILQGDSRRFADYYAEGKAASVLSAPYDGVNIGGNSHEGPGATGDENRRQKIAEGHPNERAGMATRAGYGNLPDSAITSAPYAMNDGTRGRTKSSREWDVERGYGHMAEGSEFRGDADYGSTPGQIGDLPDQPAASITSAPYSGDVKHDRTFAERDARADETKDLTNACGRGSFRGSPTYGDTPGQIGRLKDPPAVSVLSAPYAAAENRRAAGKVQEGEVSDAITRAYDATNHGQTDGQIANLPDACVTSAPYADMTTSDAQRRLGGAKSTEEVIAIRKAGVGNGNEEASYGTTEGQIARLKDIDACVTSAPFEDSLASDDPEKRGGFLKSDPKRRNDPGLTATYGDAAAVTSAPWESSLGESAGVNIPQRERTAKVTGKSQAGVTPIDVRDRAAGTAEQKSYTDAAAVTSQPYEATPGGGTPSPTGVLDQGVSERHMASRIGKTGGYAQNEQGQIGVLQAETYALACGKVYASLAKAGIRYVASVTKDPVKNKKLRPLRLLTISLFEKAGYRLVAWRRAHLFATEGEENERAGQGSLFGDELEESKRLVGRLSFFRRLSLAKGGIAARWEDVLFFELAAPAEQQTPEKPRWVQPELPGTA